jgi:hypothetical protein
MAVTVTKAIEMDRYCEVTKLCYGLKKKFAVGIHIKEQSLCKVRIEIALLPGNSLLMLTLALIV